MKYNLPDTIEECEELFERLCDRIAEHRRDQLVTDAERKLIDERLKEHRASNQQARPGEEVMQELWDSLK